jgi:hypothetical protein
MLPVGEKLAEDYRRRPARHFAIKEAREGTSMGQRCLLVWTDSDLSPGMTGGVDSSSGSPGGTTFAFAELSDEVPTATIYPRPRSVPVSAGGGIGDPDLDARFLTGAVDPGRSLPPELRSLLVSTERRSIAWFVVWGRHVCAHSVEPPGKDNKGDALISLVASAAGAFHT